MGADLDNTHWAENLQRGEVVEATLRHETNGSLNEHGVKFVVLEIDKSRNAVIGYTDTPGRKIISFSDLKRC